MRKKQIQTIYRDLQALLTERDFLKNIKIRKKTVLAVMDREVWAEGIDRILSREEVSCESVLALCQKAMEEISGVSPEEGWLSYIYHYLIQKIYPHRDDLELSGDYGASVYFYLVCLRYFLKREEEKLPFLRTRNFDFAKEPEREGSPYVQEYENFLAAFEKEYLYELMRIGREIMPFDMLAHVAGVHHISMHIARQLVRAGIPVDLLLVSGAAAGHDIGKYGCRENEVRRIPYLHYYYTDVWFKNHDLSTIGHIAANHSTWDLELDNLPVESLILIYADFRVKSRGYENGKEIMGFYSLEESFRVILDKLDNVDTAKENRYRHVYSRLEDFEHYMTALGVNVDLTQCALSAVSHKNHALLNVDETVDVFKYIAIDHNIRLMHKLSRELSFGDILEAARSTRDWKDSRAYLNIFAEYYTYMNQRQKQMSAAFLYELMFHREGDIRRQSADLLGEIIAHYDISYGKELPVDVSLVLDDTNSYEMWEKYLGMIIIPDHKMIDRHRRWMGYGLKRVVISLMANCRKENRRNYIRPVTEYYRRTDWNDETAFILLDTIASLPMELLSEEEQLVYLDFMAYYAASDSLEIRSAVLLNLKDMAAVFRRLPAMKAEVCRIMETVSVKGDVSLQYLVYTIQEEYQMEGSLPGVSYRRIFEDSRVVSDIFLDNLKAATPWKIKIVNISLLYDRILRGKEMPKLHVATHLSNLLKVSEQVSVRHYAGETLVKLAPMLSWDQRNEVAIELTKGLEIGEFEFSKYIPRYLGEFVMFLHPKELDEFINDLQRLQSSTNERVASVALDTVGVMMQYYAVYRSRFPEKIQVYEERKKRILGMILKGFANYQENVKREAFWVVGHELFGRDLLTMREKKDMFAFMGKKMLMLIEKEEHSELTFFNHTAGWNFVYRFISDYLFAQKAFSFQEPQKIAFFPGTFDPFTLGHKEIAREIRDLGFTVYLALDEFSWSKKAQPHMVRRRILHMSVADEENIYLFPSDQPVNIANPQDLKHLRELFPGKEVYMVVGSDVVRNASSYKMEPEENSIMTFPHVIFRRTTGTGEGEPEEVSYDMIQNTVVELKLPMHFEDISSTRIRENIDHNRDISNLIDTVAQNYIYENSLYLREPQYKRLLQTRSVEIRHFDKGTETLQIIQECGGEPEKMEALTAALLEEDSLATIVFDQDGRGRIDGIMVYRHIPTTELYQEFGDIQTAGYIREETSGKIVLVTACYTHPQSKIADLQQILLTEVLANCLSQDFTYAIFSPRTGTALPKYRDILERQGFVPLPMHTAKREIYVVDMKNPITFYNNVQTAIKEPFNTNPRVLQVLDEAHHRFQRALTKLYPGELVISFNAGIMYNRLIELITKANNVPKEVLPVRTLGKKMCVPFGKILKGIAIPNTVTKMLHTEKIFASDIHAFKIAEFPEYLPLHSQVRTIKSFRRPVILVDDYLHKGYRIRELDPLFKAEDVEIDRLVIGIVSGRGKDLMQIQGRKVDSAYFIPSLRVWFVETSMYPFIGGDGVERQHPEKGSGLNGINLILPYVMPGFMPGASKESIYDLSMVCLQNAKEILSVLEEEYQAQFERSLTLGRLGEVIISPRMPDRGDCVAYDSHLAASVYVENDIEQLIRLQHLVK